VSDSPTCEVFWCIETHPKSIRTPKAGHGTSMAMQVSSSGSRGLQSLVMFVVDAPNRLLRPRRCHN
jgi:hypothetical protein